MKAKAYSTTGKARAADFELPDAVFDGTVNESVLHEVITAYRANQRQGTHATKTRHTVRAAPGLVRYGLPCGEVGRSYSDRSPAAIAFASRSRSAGSPYVPP